LKPSAIEIAGMAEALAPTGESPISGG